MKNYISVLKSNPLFHNISPAETETLLDCLQVGTKRYSKGEYVFRQGDRISHITILLEGRLHVQSDDYWGNRTILNVVHPGEMFGEAYAMQPDALFLNDAVAMENCVVAFFDFNRVSTTCSASCRFHNMLIHNLFLAISAKNRRLVQKLEHISKRSTREKLLSYLSEQSKLQGSSSFTIPFNRQQLADFLSVDRSAMSNELCKLRDEGLLEFTKNSFKLSNLPAGDHKPHF